jgi:phospholipase C
LLLDFDPAGGFYDHRPPATTGVPNPDGLSCTTPPEIAFDFTRLGIRIPTVAISPWIRKGTVVHDPSPAESPTPTSKFDHTSTLATVKQIFGLKSFLTKRDAWAGLLNIVC